MNYELNNIQEGLEAKKKNSFKKGYFDSAKLVI